MKVSERELSEIVASFLLKGGGQVFAEVASLGQSADLVLLKNAEITFVEVKVNATSRAIEQCKAHELVADYVCIATATKSISSENLKILEDRGYGLISCRVAARECVWMLKPRRLGKYWGPIRDIVVDRIVSGRRDGN